MELWFTMEKLWCHGKNYGTLGKKTMLLTENYGTSIYEGKKHCRLPKTTILSFIMEKPNAINHFDLLWKSYGTMGKKTVYYEKSYDTMTRTMVQYQKLWNFDLLWKKLWCCGKKYGTIVNYGLL